MIEKKPIVGALVSGENEEETIFLLEALKKWLLHPVNFMTIDFSTRLESGVNEIIPEVLVQKCVFHAIQLLTSGLIKEFTRIKKEHLLDHIEEWKVLRRHTFSLEKNEQIDNALHFSFNDVKYAWQISNKLRNVLSGNDPRRIELRLQSFFSSS